MSRSDWGKAIAIGIAALAVAGIGALILWAVLKDYDATQTYERQDAAAYDAKGAAEQAYDPCHNQVSFVDRFNCLLREVKAKRDERRAEYDLKAQQEMARWAYGLYLLSFVGLLVTVAGVVFVGWTLQATRQMVEETKKTAVLAVEENKAAWATLDETKRATEATIKSQKADVVVTAVRLRTGLQARPFILDAEFFNIGNSPAIDILSSVRIFGDFWGLGDGRAVYVEMTTIGHGEKILRPGESRVIPIEFEVVRGRENSASVEYIPEIGHSFYLTADFKLWFKDYFDGIGRSRIEFRCSNATVGAGMDIHLHTGIPYYEGYPNG